MKTPPPISSPEPELRGWSCPKCAGRWITGPEVLAHFHYCSEWKTRRPTPPAFHPADRIADPELRTLYQRLIAIGTDNNTDNKNTTENQ